MVFRIDWANNSECIDIPFIDVSNAEELEIDEGVSEISFPGDTPSSNPGMYGWLARSVYWFAYFLNINITFTIVASSGQEHELLLEAPNTLVLLLEDILNALVDPSTKSFQSTANHQFVCQYKNPEYYLPRCFPTIFPYGRGCPSDINCNMISMANYTKHMLCLGGGPDARRFQQNAKFIFSMYTMEMRRKIGGVAYLAQRKDYDE